MARVDNKIDEFLYHSQSLFISHNLHSRFGVALLHRHYSCKEDEFILQDQNEIEKENVLITQPEKRREHINNKAPWLWTLSGGDFYPLEFTTDQLASELYESGPLPEAFLKDFGNLVIKLGADNLFGLAIVERLFYESANLEEDPVEFSDPDNRKNIICLRDKQTLNTIETTWSFKESIDPTLGCKNELSCGTTSKSVCVRLSCTTEEKGAHLKLHMPKEERHHVQRYEHKPSLL